MTRFIWTNELSYPERCLSLNLLPLSYRTEKLLILFLVSNVWVAISMLILLKSFVFLTLAIHYTHPIADFYSSKISLRKSKRIKMASLNGIIVNDLSRCRTRTEHFKAMYFNRVTHLWNVLPLEI